jgi:uncharacterized protein
VKCPICNRDAKTRDKNTAFPFCSDRCKTIDLGKWLSEEYRVPVEGETDDEDVDRGDTPPPARH